MNEYDADKNLADPTKKQSYTKGVQSVLLLKEQNIIAAPKQIFIF
jgi:hypothetical protein